MRKITFYFILLFAGMLTFTACEENEDNNPVSSGNCFVVNYGNFTGTKSSISNYNVSKDKLNNLQYEAVNDIVLSSNVAYAYEYKDKIYMIGNSADQIINVDKTTLKQTTNSVTKDIANPRHCVGEGDYLYISCLGSSPDFSEMLDSYIAKYNINTNIVEKMIAVPGGAEGVEIANGKLYVALNYQNKIAVIKLSDNSISYIATPAVTSYFVKDNSNNLYVSLISTYSKPSKNTGIGYINTTTDELTTYPLANVSNSYVSMMKPNNDFSKLYVMTSAYNDAWELSGAVAVFDIDSKQFLLDMFVDGIAGLNGFSVNPDDDNVYIFISESVEANGLMKIYSSDGVQQSSHNTGLAPFMALFIE